MFDSPDQTPKLADIIFEESNDIPEDESGLEDLDLAMPPSEDDVREQDRLVIAPPPRIAARFYRPSQARRRDSAASSRRNSMSSVHSRCSSLQPLDGNPNAQSKHAAQHIRRASFLEDRRARLADRAAHVEKVRLRAALAKAAPRGLSTFEERALAAHQARERNLAEIVTNCAEEVKKAKQVAEATKERREQELAKMRAQMEERMAEAQKRREELLIKGTARRSRGQSIVVRKTVKVLPDVAEHTVPRFTEEEAAAKIKAWWKGCSRKRVISEFNALGLHVDSIRETSIDDVIALLGRKEVLLVTCRLLRICGLCEGQPGSVEEIAAIRTFLSAFVILGHPNEVLSNKNVADGTATPADASPGPQGLHMTDLNKPQLQDLISKAKDVLISFENCLASLTHSNRYTLPSSMRNMLPEAYAVFHNAFIAWKSRDSNALIEVMILQFVELDAILETVSESTDPSAAAVYRKSIEDSQIMLFVRIKRLAGSERGRKMVSEAVREARMARRSKKETGDTKPRGVVDTENTDSASTAKDLVSPESQTLTPPSTPAGQSQRKELNSDRSGLKGLLPDNRIVVHELTINQEYQIPAGEWIEQQATASYGLYDRMEDALSTNDEDAVFSLFLVMAGFIKDKLQRLLTEGNSMHDLVRSNLNPELARRQFSLGNFSYEKFFTFISSVLPKLCAPFRDDEVKELVQNKLEKGNLVDRLKSVHLFVDLMVCDYINYLLRAAAPRLIASSAQYEAKRFAEDLEQGQVKLEAAESAWRSAYDKVMSEVQKRDVEGINHPKSRPTGSRIYAQMLVDVFTQPTPMDSSQIPEMLRLDQKRIKEVSTMIQRITTVGAVLLQCKNLLKRDVRSPWKAEATRIMAVLEANHTSRDTAVDGVMAALEAGRSMPTATKSHLRALVTKVLAASRDMSVNSVEPSEPVLRLLLARLRSNILARLAHGTATEKVKAANTAGEKLASLGLSEFVDKVRQIADLLDKVGSVDQQAHGSWWSMVAEKVREDSRLGS